MAAKSIKIDDVAPNGSNERTDLEMGTLMALSFKLSAINLKLSDDGLKPGRMRSVAGSQAEYRDEHFQPCTLKRSGIASLLTADG
jgi:hypothetical protein